MEFPSKVYITCPVMDFKNVEGSLIAISDDGYYELQIKVREKRHTYMLPITQTALICVDPLLEPSADFEVER
jgi:O-phosphoseryl-tRNA(Cys) synthetase